MLIMKKFLVKTNARVKQFYVDCRKTYSVHFTEQHKKFCLSLCYDDVNIYLLIMVKYKFKAKDSEKKQLCYCYEIIQKIL